MAWYHPSVDTGCCWLDCMRWAVSVICFLLQFGCNQDGLQHVQWIMAHIVVLADCMTSDCVVQTVLQQHSLGSRRECPPAS